MKSLLDDALESSSPLREDPMKATFQQFFLLFPFPESERIGERGREFTRGEQMGSLG